MKHLSQILVLYLFIGSLFTSCNKVEDTVLFAVPNYKSLAEIRASVSVEPSRNTNSEGKIYVTENYLFYIGQETGVHVFDNHNPATPQNIAFINIAGVHDIAVKGNYLFADNYFDLLVFDITDINNIVLAQTLENTFDFYPQYPEDVEYFDYETTANEGDFLVGYHLEYRERPEENWNEMVYDDIATNSGAVGTGGSYAKFQIRNDALYTLEDWRLNIFNIAEPTQTFFDHNTDFNAWFSGNFETLFIQKQYMFIGSTTGMHIVDISDEFNPQYISGFSHATACDPVVVHQNTAYITVRGSTTCGAIEDQINVIDITNIEQPTLTSTYLLNEPYGLGYHNNNTLYVCSSTEGLSVFDTTDATNLTLQQNYNFDVKDVIPLETHLIAVGNQKIIQFSYEANYQLEVISEVNF